MEKGEMLQKAAETLAPFETAHVMQFLRALTVKSALSSPWFIGIFLVISFYAIVVRSKFVLCALFTAISLLLLIRFTMPSDGDNLALSTTLPFAFGALAIGGFVIYLYFIKTE
jgi:hypothetical protein